MNEYILYVYCKKGRLSADSGEEARGNYASTQEAISALITKGRELKNLGAYTEVHCTIFMGEAQIYQQTV